jgi:thymidylate synthase (FAD)
MLDGHHRDCVDLYNWQVDNGVAKELARNVLPLSLYTEFYFTANSRALMNFLSLRNADAALFEIREYAKIVEDLWTEKMPVTAQAFEDNGRLAP